MEVIRLVLGQFRTNCYVIKKQGHVIIIDPASRVEKIIDLIQENEIVDAIFLTHGHFDHIGAVDKLAMRYHCDVYLHPDDNELARNEKLNSLAHFHGTIHCPTIPFIEGFLSIGPFNFEIFEAPGHTAGSVLIRLDNHLFTGDVLFKGGIGRTDLYSGNYSVMKKTLKLFSSMDEDLLVYPGHEELTTLKEELQYNPYL